MPVDPRTPPRTRRRQRRTAIARAAGVAVFVAASLATPALHAQSLLELYEGAHGYDATYLAARALADSAIYRVEQARALMRPSASLSANAGRAQTTPTVGESFHSNAFSATLSGRQPLFNRGNNATIAQAERTLE